MPESLIDGISGIAAADPCASCVIGLELHGFVSAEGDVCEAFLRIDLF
jgi:hypothetical protein